MNHDSYLRSDDRLRMQVIRLACPMKSSRSTQVLHRYACFNDQSTYLCDSLSNRFYSSRGSASVSFRSSPRAVRFFDVLGKVNIESVTRKHIIHL